MTYENKIKAVAAGVTATLFASLFTIGVMYRNNSLLSEDVKAEKVRTESLTEEKTSLKRELEKLRTELTGLESQNSELDKVIKEAQYKLAERESQIAKLNKQNAGIPALRKELDNIRQIRKDLVAQLEELQKEKSRMGAEILELNKTIAALQKENQELYARVNEKTMMAYNFRVEPVKKRKDKLTTRAKRTNKINISFDVNSPQKLAGDVYIKIRSEKEGEMEGESILAYEVMEGPETEELMASNEPLLLSSEEYKRFAVSFDPNEKLSEGVYYIKVFNGNNYLGSAQFRLRK